MTSENPNKFPREVSYVCYDCDSAFGVYEESEDDIHDCIFCGSVNIDPVNVIEYVKENE